MVTMENHPEPPTSGFFPTFRESAVKTAKCAIFNKVMEGHNLLITGMCGTGKTSIVKKIVQSLNSNLNVAVTATTGMASLQIGHDATTLHHWAGILDGRHSYDKLAELFDNDDQFSNAKKRIEEADALVIDEISMLSLKIFEMVEFVCRHVKKSSKIFGGIQVIGCGDFKQLPPVPNRRFDDNGQYCFESSKFNLSFPHHINLLEVVRQHEILLIKAVNQLCDGMPDDQTVGFLKQLDRPLNVPTHEITRLYGTNFDAQYINHDMLEDLEEELVVYKAEDEENLRFLMDCVVPKNLLLKKGAKVILVKSITRGLCNGMQGIVHHVAKDSLPIINFNEKLVTLSRASFDVFDLKQHKNLASRKQFPIILAFALTVHRAQGQTLQNVEVDCHSFFSPGQMGVAVGLAVSIDGLRLVNYNSSAAQKKHPDIVYEFYDRFFSDFLEDLSCCKDTFVMPSVECPPSDGTTDKEPDHLIETDDMYDFNSMDMEELPTLASPWDINEFKTENKLAPFAADLSPDFFVSLALENHVNYLYFNVDAIVSVKLENSQNWINAYTKLNDFILSDKHISSIHKLFKVKEINKFQNKLSTKIAFWLMEKEIEKKAKAVIAKQNIEVEAETKTQEELSSAGKSKIKYLTGACVQKISKRLKESVLRKMGQSSKQSKLSMRMDYKKQSLLKQFRIHELDVNENDDSMAEIDFKQGPSRGLTIPNDNVFDFFLSLNNVLQQKLSPGQIHLHLEELHNHCRIAVDGDDALLANWISLFDIQDDDKIEDELF